MQPLCLAALLFSAVAADDEHFLPTGGPKLDADSQLGDNEQLVTQAPEDGESSDPGHPVLPREMPHWPPNRPSRRPGNGNPFDHKVEKPFEVPIRVKRQASGFMTDEPGVPHPGPGSHLGRTKGPQRGKFPNRRNPGAMVFSPMIKVDNVTFQNITDITLKEGENIFLMPKHGGRGPHHHKGGGRHRPQRSGQYVKLIYNSTEPNKVSIEYGVVKPMTPGEIVGEEDNLTEDY